MEAGMLIIVESIFGLRWWFEHRRLLIHQYLPWCLEQAINGRLLIAFDWEKHFDKPLSEVQEICSIKPFTN
uniref:SAM-dependent methyltransferase n=1 Tax=Ascaris lumbricoides TaxID=6252 RepID=A0A0M3ILZ7_ASCLU